MKAKFQGEFHTSEADRESLIQQIDDDVDALFVEQREDSITPVDWNFGYVAFAVGALFIFWLQSVLYEGPEMENVVDVPIHDKIDTPLPDVYARIPRNWRLIFGAFSGVMFAFGLFLVNWQIPFVAPPPAVTTVMTIILKPVIVLGSFVVYSFTIVFFEEKKIGGRDQDMAQSIIEISEEEGYDEIVVSCGDAHLARLPDLLRREGWDISVSESEHRTASKIWRR